MSPTSASFTNTIVLATGNAGKIRELSAILGACVPGIRVLGLKDFPEIGEIPETGTTFEENARIKARAVAEATGLVAGRVFGPLQRRRRHG